MPEYDAFGREIGEDPLKSLREATNPLPAAETAAAMPAPATPPPATPAAQPAPITPADAPSAAEAARVDVADPETAAWSGSHAPAAEPEPQRRLVLAAPQFVRPRRRRGFGLAGLIVVVAGIGAIGLAANSVVEEGQDLIERAIPQPPDGESDTAPPVGLAARSLVRRDNFAAALATLADSGLGRPTLVRIAPDRIDTQLLKGGTLHIVQITPDGELRELGSSQGSGTPIPFKAIDPAAPERLVRRAATRKSPPRAIDYLVVSPGPPQTVGAYFKSGRIVVGDAHGRPQRVL